MPKHVRSIECCYCGASTLVNLREANEKSLKCGECGAGMAVGKMAHVSEAPDAAGWNGERPRQLSPQWDDKRNSDDDDEREWRGKREWRGDDDRDERPKPKKKKGFFDRLEDLWDEVEDIFD